MHQVVPIYHRFTVQTWKDLPLFVQVKKTKTATQTCYTMYKFKRFTYLTIHPSLQSTTQCTSNLLLKHATRLYEAATIIPNLPQYMYNGKVWKGREYSFMGNHYRESTIIEPDPSDATRGRNEIMDLHKPEFKTMIIFTVSQCLTLQTTDLQL